jgi:hypothetical protein
MFISYLKVVSHPSTAVVGQAVTERSLSPLFGGELDNGRCATLLPVEEKERLGIFDEEWFL